MQKFKAVRASLRKNIAVTACQHNRYTGVGAAYFTSQIDAVYAGRDDIREHDLEALIPLFEFVQCQFRIGASTLE